jgi:hypothetical protein
MYLFLLRLALRLRLPKITGNSWMALQSHVLCQLTIPAMTKLNSESGWHCGKQGSSGEEAIERMSKELLRSRDQKLPLPLEAE